MNPSDIDNGMMMIAWGAIATGEPRPRQAEAIKAIVAAVLAEHHRRIAARRVNAERRRQFAEAYATGLSLREVGALFGCTRENVRAMLLRAGVELRPRGKTREGGG